MSFADLYRWQHALRGRALAAWSASVATFVTRREQPVVERVLVVICGHLGDTVMCTPALIEAKRLWPAAELTLLGGPGNVELLRACPHVDRFEISHVDPLSLRGRADVHRLRDRLRAHRFDVAIVLLGDQYGALLAQARIPVRVGATSSTMKRCFSTTYDPGTARTWGPAERLRALSCLHPDVGSPAARLWVDAACRESARERLRGLGVAPDRPYVALHPFGSTPRQRWPIERVAALASRLDAVGLHTLLVGGREAVGRVPTNGAIVDLTGQLALGELLAVIEGARVVVTTDSGPFHMAGALGRPIVGLFRGSRPEHAARYPNARVLCETSSACANVCRWDHCAANPCRQMELLSVDAAAAAVEHLRAGT